MNKNDNKDRIEVGLPDGSLFNYGNATIRSVCIQSSGRYNDPSANDIPDARTRTRTCSISFAREHVQVQLASANFLPRPRTHGLAQTSAMA